MGQSRADILAADVTPPEPAQDGDRPPRTSATGRGDRWYAHRPRNRARPITGLSLPRGIERDILALIAERTVAYSCLLASPVLLVLGSLLPGI